MKKTDLRFSFALTTLACAVALATAAKAELPQYSVTTGRVLGNTLDRTKTVTDFASTQHEVMQSPASLLYLKNKKKADSSTFAARLVTLMKSRPFKTAPNMPVPAADLSCYTSVPSYSSPEQFDVNTTPVTVEADKVSGDLNKQNNDLVYSGRVNIAQRDRRIDTDTAHYAQKEQTFTTHGNTVIRNGEYTVHTQEDAIYHLQDKSVQLRNTKFQFNGSVLRGSAKQHDIDNAKNSQTFKSGTLTTCPADDSSWHLSASTVDIDRNEAFGEAWNAALWAGPVPVFYLPYVNFPITNERRTGLLYPSFSLGSEHIKFTQPVYFNLAPNYDWTFTPSWFGERRWQFLNEFRFMPWENVSGSLIFNYLPNDTDWTPRKDPDGSHKRWYMHLHTGASFLNGDLYTGINFQRVRPNDYSYLTDLAQPDAATTDDHLLQQLHINYVRPHYTLAAELRRYQSLIPETSGSVANRPFSMLPKLSGTMNGTYDRLSGDLYGEITRFEMESFDNYYAEHTVRTHLEPHVSYHVFDLRGTTLDIGARGFATHYDQGQLDKYKRYDALGFDSLDHSETRFLYELEARGRTTFERKAFDMRHTQTIEPEIKYQYIPYVDQSGIALYDTKDHLDDYYSLFSFRRFAGIDRIADVNAVTAGITSRILDPHDREILRMGLAQTYNFEPTRVTLLKTDERPTYPRSLLAANLDASVFNNITLHSAAAYDTEHSEFQSYSLSAAYRTATASITANYRFYRNGNYDLENYKKTGAWKSRDLRQAGIGATFALGRNYRLTAAMYRDLDQNFNIDRKLALRRENCCTAVALFYEDYAKMEWSKREHKRDRVIGVQIELKNFYTIKVDGVDNPMSPNTHYMPFVDPTNLNR